LDAYDIRRSIVSGNGSFHQHNLAA
jgi:hypothetical protein